MVATAEKYAPEIEIFTLDRGFPGSDFTQQRVKNAFSPADIQAIWVNRLFQQNRPTAAFRSARESMCATSTLPI